MVMVNINYPEKGCSTPCAAMRCQKCVLHNSESVSNYLAKDREKDKPDWCPIIFGPSINSAKEVKDFDEFGNHI